MILQTTLSLAAAAAAINLWLFIRISQLRFGRKIVHGDGGEPLLARRMRAHANFAENLPLVLILVAAIEMTAKAGLACDRRRRVHARARRPRHRNGRCQAAPGARDRRAADPRDAGRTGGGRGAYRARQVLRVGLKMH